MENDFIGLFGDLLVIFAVWALIGYGGYKLSVKARFSSWKVPNPKKKDDAGLLFVCVLGGFFSVLIAGTLILLQVSDEMKG